MADATFVQSFIRFYLVAILVAHSHQQEASLSAIDCDLADGFIKTLIEEFFPDWADTNLFRPFLDEPLIEFLLQLDDLDFGGRG